ncbi:MAG: hypothetical protein RIT24_2285 [Planctomycetota bacterium]
MPVRESPMAKFERLLEAGDNEGALLVANEVLRQSPGSFFARLGRARALMRLRNFIDADTECNLALQVSPKDDLARVVRAALDARLGRTDDAVANLRLVARGRSVHAQEAQIDLLQTLHDAGRLDEMAEEAKAPGAWRNDPRARLHFARILSRTDKEAAAAEMAAIFRTNYPWVLRRFSGFEAVGILDKLGRYRDAFDLATEIHKATTAPLDLNEWLPPMDQQIALLAKGAGHFKPRAERVEGVAFIAAMPRSGTTLLEQMLDRHPAIGGIGEFDGIDHVCRSLWSTGSWPRVPGAVPNQVFADLQKFYLAGARHIRKPGATWTFDKTLRGWRALAEIACVLPGSVCINVERDPRDMATSIYLSYFNPTSYEWTAHFSAIRQIAEYQRRMVPLAFEVLGLANERIVYEDLVEDPAHYASRCLSLMGLEMDERVLRPEENTKTAATLSHAQVRQPINKKSIGRWKNYEWAFDASWDKVVSEHEARRKSR